MKNTETTPNAAHAETPRPTPRTDEALWHFNDSKGDVVSADFARQLERELNEQIESHGQTAGIVSDAFRERDEANRRASLLETELQAERLRGAALRASAEFLAKIPIEAFGWSEKHRTRPVTAWNGHELRVGHVLGARSALTAHAEGKHQAI